LGAAHRQIERSVNLTSEARLVKNFLHKESYISKKADKAKTTVHQIIKNFMETSSVADDLEVNDQA